MFHIVLAAGLFAILHPLGFNSDPVTSGAVSGEAGRDSSEAIAGYLTDADGDGESKPFTDGLLLIRYLFGVLWRLLDLGCYWYWRYA